MPTGYTEIIEKGCTFEEYVWRCVRGMGVTILMRDDSLDVPVPKRFEASDYHEKALKEAQAKLAALKRMTKLEKGEACAAEYRERLRAWEESEKERKAKVARYEEMRAKAADWAPPTPGHVGLKEFMLQQIDLCLPGEQKDYLGEPKPIDPAEWHQGVVKRAAEAVAYHAKALSEEEARTEDRNAWLLKLRASVPQPKGGGP